MKFLPSAVMTDTGLFTKLSSVLDILTEGVYQYLKSNNISISEGEKKSFLTTEII